MVNPLGVDSDKRLVQIEFWLSFDYSSTARCKYVYCVKRSLNARVSCDNIVAAFVIPSTRNIFAWIKWVHRFKDKPGVCNMFKSVLKKEVLTKKLT